MTCYIIESTDSICYYVLWDGGNGLEWNGIGRNGLEWIGLGIKQSNGTVTSNFLGHLVFKSREYTYY